MPFDPTDFAGQKPKEPILNLPTVVLAVVAVLWAVHGALWLLGQDWQVWSVYALAFIPARLGGGEAIPFPQGAQVWSFFTYALLHADMYHLGSNSIWLAIFSTPLARRFGPWRYLAFLLLSAAAGAAVMLPAHWGQFLLVVGASASVSATLAGAIPIMFAPGFRMMETDTLSTKRLVVPHPLELLRNSKVLAFAALFLVMTLLTGASQVLTGTAFLEERNIAWEAHLGGFVAGLILFYILDKRTVSTSAKA